MARNLNGSNGYITSSAASLNVPCTVSAWVYIGTADAGAIPNHNNGLSGNNQHELGLFIQAPGDGQKVVAILRGQNINYQNAVTTTTYPTGQWFHACAVFTSTSSRAAYLNGGSKGTNTTTLSVNNMTTTIHVGATNAFDMAESAIWTVALSDAEVLALSKGINPRRVRPQNLSQYWPMWGLDTNEVTMVSGGFNLTVLGTPAKANHPPVVPFCYRRSFIPGVAAAAGGPGVGSLSLVGAGR